MKRLIAIIDETGTSNRPSVSEESDFAIAAVICDPSRVTELVAAGKKIASISHKADFKYKDVQKESEARRTFIDILSRLKKPEGLFGFYVSGAALYNERRRALAATQRFGTDADGSTRESLRRMVADPNNEMLISFLEYTVPSLGQYAADVDAQMEVYFDRRNDLDQVISICDQSKCLADTVLPPALRGRVVFKGPAQKEHYQLVRIAGAVAGDLRAFFRRHGSRIFRRLRETNDLDPRQFDNLPHKIPSSQQMLNVMRVHTFQDKIADDHFFDGSPDTCMLRGYCKHFVKGLISFASPEGKMCLISIEHTSLWNLHQLPD